MRALELNVATLEATVEQRLEAGVKTFETVRKLIEDGRGETAELRRAITPKKVSYLSLAGLMLSAGLACGGLVWALSDMMSERPTRGEMDQRFDSVKAQVERESATLKVGIDDQRDQLQSFRTQVTKDLAEIKINVKKPRQ